MRYHVYSKPRKAEVAMLIIKMTPNQDILLERKRDIF